MKRFEAAGWDATRIDGHDPDAIAAALEQAQTSDRPTLIACKTTIGYGAPTKAGTDEGARLAARRRRDRGRAREARLDRTRRSRFPADILDAWRAAGAARASRRTRLGQAARGARRPSKRAEFERRMRGELPAALDDAIARVQGEARRREAEGDRDPQVGRESRSRVLIPAVPEMIGGSADLTGSNNTTHQVDEGDDARPITAGRYIHYGIREHGMAAAMNGMALHGGIIPYCGTFLVFSDYCRPAIRLAALMGERVIHVMTHDSIGLGEDGPTHQPVEHLAALRAIPNLKVFRPADAVETVECWQLALEAQATARACWR